MDADHEPESLPTGAGVVDHFATVVGVARRILLFCLPTAAVVFLYQGFGDQHYRAFAVTLAVLVVSLSAWTIAVRPADQDTLDALLTAWFYNMTVFGAAVLAVRYAGSPVRYLFLVGFPLAAVEFRRHISGDDHDGD